MTCISFHRHCRAGPGHWRRLKDLPTCLFLCVFLFSFFTVIVQKSESEQDKKLHCEMSALCRYLEGTPRALQRPARSSETPLESVAQQPPQPSSKKLLLESLGRGENRFFTMCEMDGRSSPTGPSWVWRAGASQTCSHSPPSLTVPTARGKHNAAQQGHLEFGEQKVL